MLHCHIKLVILSTTVGHKVISRSSMLLTILTVVSPSTVWSHARMILTPVYVKNRCIIINLFFTESASNHPQTNSFNNVIKEEQFTEAREFTIYLQLFKRQLVCIFFACLKEFKAVNPSLLRNSHSERDAQQKWFDVQILSF